MGHGAPVSPDMAAPGGAPPYGAPYDPAAGPPAYPPTAGGYPPAAVPPGYPPAGDAAGSGYAAPPAADAAAPWRGGSSSTFQTAMESARRDLDAGRVVEAHQQLSIWYDDPRLSPAEQQQLCDLLDQVAGTVVYSTQNLLEAPVEVQPGERLEDIAQRYQVSPQLLAKINGIEDPNSLRPGERLKVVRGPFAAVVNVEKKQLTVLLNGAYAGRFPIGIGAEHPPQEGQFAVTEKAVKPTYYGPNRTVDPEDPANPLGKRWIGLGNQLGIHGTNDPANIGRNGLPGCISLGDRDADDVFDILSVGSRVIIRR
jgi:lipoprotein-anchoring transpeptidase ErfK/SrfK